MKTFYLSIALCLSLFICPTSSFATRILIDEHIDNPLRIDREFLDKDCEYIDTYQVKTTKTYEEKTFFNIPTYNYDYVHPDYVYEKKPCFDENFQPIPGRCRKPKHVEPVNNNGGGGYEIFSEGNNPYFHINKYTITEFSSYKIHFNNCNPHDCNPHFTPTPEPGSFFLILLGIIFAYLIYKNGNK